MSPYLTPFTISDNERRYAQRLIDSGYRATSNKHRMASRIDREDWREYMAKKHAPWSEKQGKEWVAALGEGAGDFYRRVYSKDNLRDLPDGVFWLIKKAGQGYGWGGTNTYVDMIHADRRALILEDA